MYDHKKIAFSSYRDGNWEIYVMNNDGSDQINLTNHHEIDGRPDWSPDGSKIVFITTRNGVNNSEIYTMNPDGSDQTRLTFNDCADSYPSWSPDGNKIAFTSLRNRWPEIYIMNTDGSNQTRLTYLKAETGGPDWSPDGSMIVFWSDIDARNELPYDPEIDYVACMDIYIMKADGSNITRLTKHPNHDYYPDWSSFRIK